jgi:hypothetical protein
MVLGLILVVFTWGWWSFQKDLVEPAVKVVNVPINIVKSVATTTGIIKKSSTPMAATLSYTDALAKYEDVRIQLDDNCRANPNKVTFKNGTSIMIDNRASVARTVTVGSTFSLKAYDFKIVKLSSAVLPVTWYLDCDKSQNVATILIQK